LITLILSALDSLKNLNGKINGLEKKLRDAKNTDIQLADNSSK